MVYENEDALAQYYEQISSACAGADECMEVRIITPGGWGKRQTIEFIQSIKDFKHDEGLPTKPWNSLWFQPGQEGDFVEYCLALATEPEAQVNVFAGPNPRGTLGGTTDASVTGSMILFADGDAEQWDPSGTYVEDEHGNLRWNGNSVDGMPYLKNRIDELIVGPIVPSMVVYSGHGLHPYIRLSDRLVFPDDLDLWKILMDRFRLAVSAPGHRGADNIGNPSRIMRLPGVVNYKGSPIPTRLDHCEPTAVYSVDYLDKHLPKLRGPAARRTAVLVSKSRAVRSRHRGPIDGDLEKLILALDTDVTRWKSDSDGNFSLAVLDKCMYCEGGTNDDRGTAFVTSFGHYKCHRAKCRANKGVNVRSWASEFARAEKLALVLFQTRSSLRGLARNAAAPRSVPYSQRDRAMDQIIEEAVAASLRDNAPKVVSVSTGSGKTTAAGKRGAFKSIALFLKTHKLCTEMKDHFVKLGVPASRIGTYTGVATGCSYAAVKKFPDAELARSLFCWSCPDRPTCAAHQNDCSVEVLLAPHAAYQTLQRSGALNGREVYFDEKPRLTEEGQFSLKDLQDVAGPSHRKLKRALYGLSFECMDAAAIIVKQFEGLVEEWRREYSASPERLPRGLVVPLGHVSLDFSDDELATIADAGDSAAGGISRGVANDIRHGRKDLRVRLGIPKLFAAIHCTLAGTADDAKGMVEITMKKPDPSGNVVVVFRILTMTKYEVPLGGSLVFLDATAYLQPHEYNAACREELEHFRLEVEPHPRSTVNRLLLAHNGASRAKSCDGRCGASGAGRMMLTSTLCTFAGEARKILPHGVNLAVITHKPLADELTKSFFGKRLQKELVRHGVSIEHVGYFGADERASNSMQDCDAIMVIGDPIPNIDSMHTLAEAVELFTGYKVSPQALINGEKFATTSQALGRLRAFTRSGEFILCCVSNTFPEGWGSDNTRVINLSTGGGLPPLQRLRSHWPELDAEIENVLTEYGVCSPRLVSRWLRYQFVTAGTRDERNHLRHLGKLLKDAPERTRQSHFKKVCGGRAKIHRLGKSPGVVWADLAVKKPEEVKSLLEDAQQDMEAKTASLGVTGAVAV